MSEQIKPIETVYKGYRFRSRLEARWAVFFETLGLKWSYEVEGFQLPSGWYLPDFWIDYEHEVGWGFFIEIKSAALTEDETQKLAKLAELSGHRCYSLSGQPWPGEHECSVFQHHRIKSPPSVPLLTGALAIELKYHRKDYFIGDGGDRPSSSSLTPIGEDIVVYKGDRHDASNSDSFPFPSPKYRRLTHRDLSASFTAARQARFEHGESP